MVSEANHASPFSVIAPLTPYDATGLRLYKLFSPLPLMAEQLGARCLALYPTSPKFICCSPVSSLGDWCCAMVLYQISMEGICDRAADAVL